MGKILKATIVLTNNDTYEHLDDYRNKHIDSISKVNYALTRFLMESVNSTPVLQMAATWGYRNPKTGYWGGMIGQLADKEIDIGGK